MSTLNSQSIKHSPIPSLLVSHLPWPAAAPHRPRAENPEGFRHASSWLHNEDPPAPLLLKALLYLCWLFDLWAPRQCAGCALWPGQRPRRGPTIVWKSLVRLMQWLWHGLCSQLTQARRDVRSDRISATCMIVRLDRSGEDTDSVVIRLVS